MAINSEIIARAYALQQQARDEARLTTEAVQAFGERQREAEATRRAEAARAAEQARLAEEARLAEIEYNRSRTAGEVAQDVGLQALSGAVGLGQAAYGLANIGTLGLLERGVGLAENFPRTQQILAELQSAPTQRAAARVGQAFDESLLAGAGAAVTEPLFLQQLLVGSAPSLLPGVAAARLGGAAGTAAAQARGLTGAAAETFAAQASQRALQRAVAGQVGGAVNVETIAAAEQGATPFEQQIGGLGAGLLAGAAAPLLMRATGAGAVEAAAARGTTLTGGSAALVPTVASAAAREAVEESAQSASERIAQNLFVPNTPLFDGVGEQAVLGGIAGGVLGGGMGGIIGMSTIRTSSDTELGRTIRDRLAAENEAAGSPLQQSGLGDSPLAGNPEFERALAAGVAEEIDLAATPLPVEEIDLAATPLPGAPPAPEVAELGVEEVAGAQPPLRGLVGVLGDFGRLQRPPLPTPTVEELPPPPLTGALAAIQAQRSRGQLGGTDLFAAPLPPEGAFPQAAPAAEVAPAPAAAPAAQLPIDFDAPAPTWKQTLARQLGLKPQHLRGKAWDEFSAAVEAAGLTPQTATPEQLAAIAAPLGTQYGDTSLFAAELATRYQPAAAPVAEAPAAEAPAAEAPRAGMLQDALAMTEDEYIAAVNPTGKRTSDEDVVIVHEGDLDLPDNAQLVEQFATKDGATVDVYSADGNYYAVNADGTVVGQIERDGDETLNIVTVEAQGQGVGTGLATAMLRREPFAPAGSFSAAGEATRRAAFRRLQAEAEPAPAPTPAPTPAPADPLRVLGSKQVRGGYDEGTYHEVSLSDGQQARVFRQTGDGGVQLSGWYLADDTQFGTYLGETKADALRALPELLTRRAAAQQVEPASVPTETPTPGSPGNDGMVAQTVDQMIQQTRKLDPTLTEAEAAVDTFVDIMVEAPSIELLSDYYGEAKDHPLWDAMTAEQRKYVTDNFDRLYAKLEGTTKFDRVTTGEAKIVPMDLTAFSEAISNYNAARPAGSPEIVAVENVAGFEAMTGRSAPYDARGAYFDNRVYVIHQNVASPKDLATVIAHERGHAGLEALLGDRMPAVLNRLWTNAATRTRIRAKMNELGGTVDAAQGGLRRLAAEEVLADMLAGGEQVTGDVISKARAAIDNTFARLLGVADLRMTNAEVDSLLRDTAKVMRGMAPATIDMDKSHFRGIDSAMASPEDFVAGDPRFSRASAELDRIIEAAQAESDGTRKNVADVAREGGAAALQAIRSVGSATAADKARKLAMDFIPLNQLANLYDKYFAGRLSEFSRLKRQKEATSNKVLTGPTELNYHGEKLGKLSPMTTADAIRKFGRQNPSKLDAWNTMQQEATRFRIFPDRSWEQQKAIRYENMGFSEVDRREAHRNLQRLWKSVGPEGQRLFKETQAIYSSLWSQRFNALKADIARVLAPQGMSLEAFYKTPEFRREYGDRIDSALKRMSDGPYSPLTRYGDYLVTVRDTSGKVVWFSGHETIEEANNTRKELMAAEFAGAEFRPVVTLRREMNWELEGISQQTIDAISGSVDALASRIGNPQLVEQIRAGLTEAYLQSLPQGSFLQHANKRKNIAGATTDAFRAFSDYSMKAARSIASLRYDGLITTELAELQTHVTDLAGDEHTILRQRVLEAVKRQHSASLQATTNKVADAFSQAGFLWFLSSPSQLIINSMQTPMVTLPRLAGAYGSSAALREIRAALADFARSRGDMLRAGSPLEGTLEHAVLQDLYERGTLDFTLAHDMAALARGEVGSSMSGHWRKMLEIGGVFMHKSEVFNRQVVALAAARLEAKRLGVTGRPTAAQLKQIADAADTATLTTQFDYSQTNKATVVQGPWRKLVFQFQQYRLNMLAMIGKDIRDSFTGTPEEKRTARTALAWTLGTQLALTGAAGTVLAPIVFAIADAFRDDDDLLDSRTEFLRAAPQILAHGVVAGALDLSRVDGAGLVTFGGNYAPVDASAKETFQYYVMANLGPWAGLGANLFTGIEKAMEGDHVAAVKNLAPAGARDVYRAFFESQQGAKDARQIVYFEPGVWDTMTGAMGLRSGQRREVEEIRGATYTATKQAQMAKTRYLSRLALGYATADQELISEAMAGIQDWNAKHPDLAVKASDIRRAVVSRAKSQAVAEQYGVVSAAPPAPSIQQAVGAW